MIQIIDGEIKQTHLPTTGILISGETVSGYNLLPLETLKLEGWLPLENIEPDYDVETHYLVDDGYEILEDKVIKKYRIEDIPEPQIPQIILLQRQIEELTLALGDALLGGGL